MGEIVIVFEVIEVIIGIVVFKVEGVYGMCGIFVSNVIELLGWVVYGKGVYLVNEEDGLKVDFYCYLEYGVLVFKVVMEM